MDKLTPKNQQLLDDLAKAGVPEKLVRQVKQAILHTHNENFILRTAVYSDHKTGLSSFKYYNEHIEPEIVDYIDTCKKGTAPKYQLYIGIADVNAMNIINEKLSHAGGDIIIKRVAKALARSIRNYDWVGRFSDAADEFIILLRVEQDEDASKVIEAVETRIHAKISRIMVIDTPLSISVGFVDLSDFKKPAQALEAASLAMYTKKKLWRKSVRPAFVKSLS